MTWRGAIQRALRRAGFDLRRFDLAHPLRRRMRLVEGLGIDLLLDVGANAGQYALQMRGLGYRGRIVSFEPLPVAFAELARVARGDGSWRCEACALGEAEASATLQVAANSWSSSLLEMLEAHAAAAPESRTVGREVVRVRTLDALLPELARPADRIFLKVDTQGFERRVLEGAGKSLPRMALIQLECSLAPLYAGEHLLGEQLAWLAGRGFTPVSFEDGFVDPRSGRQLQVDVLFAAQEPAAP